MKRLLLAIALCGLVSCGGSNPTTIGTPAPPKVSLDLQMARSLLTTQKIIEGDLSANPPIIGLVDIVKTNPSFKPVLNQIIAGYNTAEAAYLVYHQALAQGATPDSAVLQGQIADLKDKAQALVASLGGKP